MKNKSLLISAVILSSLSVSGCKLFGAGQQWKDPSAASGQTSPAASAASDPTQTQTSTNQDQTQTPTNFEVSISKAGSGAGTVTSNVGSISCGDVCSGSITGGQSVTLTATPSGISTFDHWSGACEGSTSPTCTFTATSNSAVVAQFNDGNVYISGTTGAGAPLYKATVTVRDANNNYATGTPDVNGRYTVPVSGMTAPLAVKNCGWMATGRSTCHYSIAYTLGETVNVNPMTSSVIGLAIGRDPSDLFNLNMTPSQSAVSTANGYLVNALTPALTAVGVSTSGLNLINVAYVADRTGLDKVMDYIKFMTNSDGSTGIANVTYTRDMTGPAVTFLTMGSAPSFKVVDGDFDFYLQYATRVRDPIYATALAGVILRPSGAITGSDGSSTLTSANLGVEANHFNIDTRGIDTLANSLYSTLSTSTSGQQCRTAIDAAKLFDTTSSQTINSYFFNQDFSAHQPITIDQLVSMQCGAIWNNGSGDKSYLTSSTAAPAMIHGCRSLASGQYCMVTFNPILQAGSSLWTTLTTKYNTTLSKWQIWGQKIPLN